MLIVGSGRLRAQQRCASSPGTRRHSDHQVRLDANTPQAHIINQRAIEIFRDLGIRDQVKAYANTTGRHRPTRGSSRPTPPSALRSRGRWRRRPKRR
jgi:hypothetical protein